jgi:glycerol-3-phosphate dehydrogenase
MITTPRQQAFDAIVIGSGIGGLTVAGRNVRLSHTPQAGR